MFFIIKNENTLNCLSNAMDKIFCGVIVTDKNGIVIAYNDAASEYEGFTKEEAFGQHVNTLYLGKTDSNKFKSQFITCMERALPILNVVKDYSTSSGIIISVMQNYYPVIYDNEIIGSFCILTKKDKLEKAVNEINKLIRDAKIDNKKLSTINFDAIIGQSPTTIQAIDEAKKVSLANVNSLIVGETGTGKELFVRSIHNSSCRHNEPFVPINCAAIPENLLESMLFGTTKGAFTDSRDSIGLFEVAENGTLFLDELDSMSLACQSKILRAIEEKKIRKLGSEKEIPVNCRVIGALSQNPTQCIKDNTLRRDLFYRLSIACIIIPPLRERLDDIPLILNHFIEINNKKYDKSVESITPELFNLFLNYNWEGNIREFINVIEGMFVLLDDTKLLGIEHLSHYNYRQIINHSKNIEASIPEKDCLNDCLAKYEKNLIQNMLVECKGNKRATAEKLNISPQVLHYKLQKFDLK